MKKAKNNTSSSPAPLKISLEDIKAAQQVIEPVIRKTELEKSFSASQKMKIEVFFKYENRQFTGSFKLRGAYNKINSLTDAERKAGVVASSAGNHAQGVAFSAAKAKVSSTIVMPLAAPLVKVTATQNYGAKVVLHGEIYDEAYEKARELERSLGLVFVHPYEDPMIIAGQGTIGLEILDEVPDLDSIIIPIGGGGLISGIATAIKALRPKCKVFGVQSVQAPSIENLFHKRKIQEPQKRISTIADGIAVKRPSQNIFDTFIHPLVDDVVTVTDDEIAEAIVFLLERSKAVAEGAGAAGLAALLNRRFDLGKKTCVLLSGGNIDLNMIAKIIEKGQIRKGRLVELSVIVDDIPGNLNRITSVLAQQKANVLEVHHDRVSQGLFLRETRIDFVIETSSSEHIRLIREAVEKVGARII